MSTYRYRLGCAVPEYKMANDLADGVRLFDSDAFIHIKESNEDNYWDLVALFNLNGGMVQYLLVNKLFAPSVTKVGGRQLR